MKPDKVLRFRFLFDFLALIVQKNTIVVYSVVRIEPIETCWFHNSCIVS